VGAEDAARVPEQLVLLEEEGGSPSPRPRLGGVGYCRLLYSADRLGRISREEWRDRIRLHLAILFVTAVRLGR
jgi:hypothetical protein